jgi:predicted ABC-type exoprotein transport system permease subunit
MIHTFMASPSSLALALPPGTVDWVGQFTTNLANLTSQNGGALTQLGMTELSFISLFVLVNMVIDMNLSTMAFTFHRQPMHIGDLIRFMLRLIVCLLLESYWVNPLPGVGFGFNHLFSAFAQSIVTALDQNSLSNLQNLLSTAGQQTTAPSITAPIQILCYMLVQILLGAAQAILFLINVSGFIFYGVSALFGPIFIPLYMTKTLRGKALQFADVLLSLAMIRAVAAAFIFVWEGFMNGFIQQTFNGNYSMQMWIANLIPCVMVFLAFDLNMIFIPSMTQMLFGGGAGVAGRLEESAGKLAAAL